MNSGLSSTDLKEITTAFGTFALDSGLSFYRTAGEPLKAFASTMLNIGAKRGKATDINELNISRKAIKTQAMNESSKRIDLIKPFLRACSERGEICFSVDHGKRFFDYLSLIAHFVVDDEGWKMISRPIGFLRVAPEEKDYKHIFIQIQELCTQVGINRYYLEECTVISDEGSNVVKAVKGNFKQELKCACHVTCTCIRHIFEPYKKRSSLNEAEKELLKIANSILEACKILVSLARNPKKNFKLPKHPRQFVSTRFMSALFVIEDIFAFYDHILQISEDMSSFNDKEQSAINFVLANKRKMKFLIDLLKPVEDNVKLFEGENYPTLHFVPLFWQEQLKVADSLKESPEAFNRAIGKAYLEALQRKKKLLTSYHYAAAMLYPPTKNMLMFSEEEREEAKICLAEVCLPYEPEPPEQSAAPSETAKAPRFASMFDQRVMPVDTFEKELKRYLDTEEHFFNPEGDLLKWWEERDKQYPRLRKAARKILSIPASSTAPERSFSKNKLVITDQRTNTSAATVSGLMLGGSY